MMYRWIYKPPPLEDLIDSISSSLGFSYLASKILVMRGIDSYPKAREFFKPKESDIHDPFLMSDMRDAVQKIISTIKNGKKILLFGDYDVDGTTAVALMYLYLNKIYKKEYLDFYIPDRNLEGYGISTKAINFAKENSFSLIIALDCGIKSTSKIQYANNLGINFIICDHHLPGDELPKAVAVLDPKRKDCQYPYKELSGCGVGYKLCQALNTIYKIPDHELHDLTDLLAISIAADVVPITGENRILAKMGINNLRKTKRKGLKALIPYEKIKHLTISNIIFEIAPKINAAGRISHGKSAVELMITEDSKKAHLIANQIINMNDERKNLDSNMTQQAIEQVIKTQQEDTYSTVVYQAGWNKGVIGIVASRLIELYYKPTLVFTDGNNGEMVASARSVSDFDLYQALNSCSNLFLKFGGHYAAAGLSMEKKNFETFKKKFEEIVKNSIKEHQKTPSIEIDSEVSLNDLTNDFFQFYRWLSPFGPQNMKPILVIKNARVIGNVKRIGKQNSHLKFNIIQNNVHDVGKVIECLAFKMEQYANDFRLKTFDIAFTIEENHWKDNLYHYLNIRDVIFH